MELHLPVAITGVFQGLLLFFLLASYALIENRYRFSKKKNKATAVTTQVASS